jgi:formylmethanofuran dehydrogenase subunit E-like metal-binding protein
VRSNIPSFEEVVMEFLYFVARERGFGYAFTSFLTPEERRDYMKELGGSFVVWDEEVIYPSE